MNKLFFFAVLLLFINCSEKQKVVSPPSIAPQPVLDSLHGITFSDPYRFMENQNDSLVNKWYEDHSNRTISVFDSINGRKELLSKMMGYSDRVSNQINSTKLSEKGEYFYLKRTPEESFSKLYYRSKYSGKEELLFDPKQHNPNEEHEYSINYYMPSWDTQYVVISLSYSGKEISDLVILDMKTRQPLPQILNNAWPSSYLGVNWLPDNSGFIFLHFPQADPKANDFKANTHSVLYKIGDSPTQLKKIFGSESNPELNIPVQGTYPIVKIKQQDDPYLIGYLAGVDNYWDAYYIPIDEISNTTINWRPLYTKKDKIVTSLGVFDENTFIYKTAINSSNFEIQSLEVILDEKPIFNKAKILLSDLKDEVIGSFRLTSNGLYVGTTKNGVEAKLYLYSNEENTQITLPQTSGKLWLQTISNKNPDFWIYTSGWTSGIKRYQYSDESKKFEAQPMSAKKASYPEFDDFITEEILVKSYDGVEIPFSIIRHKNTPKNNKNRVFMYGYGAYGDATNPFFSPIFLTWVEQGGIFCAPHVRGGGEKGDAWHKAGMMNTKENSWKDLISCAEYLIDEGYTSSNLICINADSAGGILVGRAMTERPDLFKAVVSSVGNFNPLRGESRLDGGGSNFKEYGTVKDSTQFRGLLKMDPYMNIQESATYPAVYLTAGANDTRVPAWMPGKFIARLQNSTISDNPILFYVDNDGGHSTSASKKEKYHDKYAKMFSFFFWQTDHPDYLPNESK